MGTDDHSWHARRATMTTITQALRRLGRTARTRAGERAVGAVISVMLCAVVVVPAAAASSPHSSALAHPGPTAAVAMGDSYMSGEGSRWLGNSTDLLGSSEGTDRACSPSIQDCTSLDPSKVYLDGSYQDGCHQSDVAEIHSADLPVQESINLACSGAVSSDLWLSANGGTTGSHKQEPQSDQLIQVARTHDVKLIMVMIGGNDVNFAGLITDCFTAYEAHSAPCSQTQTQALNTDVAAALPKIEKVIVNVREAMSEAGYAPGSYRLALQTYPIVIPDAAQARYPQSSIDRTLNGCPFYDSDMNWAKNVAGPTIDGMVEAAAAAEDVPVLNLLNAFDGHEICANSDSTITATIAPSPTVSEWGRGVSVSTIGEGQEQEIFHPDAYGDMAMGACLHAFYAAAVANYSCSSAAGLTPSQEMIQQASLLPAECTVGRAHRHQRQISLTLNCSTTAAVTISANRGRKRLAHVTRDLETGRTAVALNLPAHIIGRVRITVRTQGAAGDTRTYRRDV